MVVVVGSSSGGGGSGISGGGGTEEGWEFTIISSVNLFADLLPMQILCYSLLKHTVGECQKDGSSHFPCCTPSFS